MPSPRRCYHRLRTTDFNISYGCSYHLIYVYIHTYTFIDIQLQVLTLSQLQWYHKIMKVPRLDRWERKTRAANSFLILRGDLLQLAVLGTLAKHVSSLFPLRYVCTSSLLAAKWDQETISVQWYRGQVRALTSNMRSSTLTITQQSWCTIPKHLSQKLVIQEIHLHIQSDGVMQRLLAFGVHTMKTGH